METRTDMKIGTKLIALVVVLCALIAVTAICSIYNIKSIDTSYKGMYNQECVGMSLSSEIGMEFNEGRIAVTSAMNQQDPGLRSQALAKVQKSDAEVEEGLSTIEKTAITDKARNEMQQLRNQISAYQNLRNQFLAEAQAGQIDPAKLAQGQKEAAAIGDKIDGIHKLATSHAQQRMNELDTKIAMIILVLSVAAAAIIIAALFIGISIAHRLSRRINVLGAATNEIAEGNLTKAVVVTARDELGLLGESFEKMRLNMLKAISEIHVAADQVAAGSKNVSDASISLSQGAAEQASSVEELSASIAEISSQTRSNAENADNASQLTLRAKGNAKNGDNDMKEMLQAMEEINVSSGNISKIIKVIDEIAFQTNILALNAAVEAARAGQHGKGFAVVAEEVRNLAARSAKAARETTDMIEGSIAKVTEGRKIANKTAEALQTIVTHVSEAADLVGNIAKASNEQNIALEQINQGVLQISQVVQANSATAEESAAASEELNAQADLLRVTTNKFNIGAAAAQLSTAAPKNSASAPAAAPADKPKHIAITEEEGFGKY